jgi:hypothetical protein
LIAVNDADPTDQFAEEKVEAPPGFEPGVEVLQTGSRNANLLSRLAFWSALICDFTRFSAGSVPKLFLRPLFP